MYLWLGFAALSLTTSPKMNESLQPFGYSDVQITRGPFFDQAKIARQFYLNLNEDSLLQGFRVQAHLPAPGKPMGGWYDPDGFAAAHPFGQFISALARMYKNTGDIRFKQKVDRLVHGFGETIRPDGCFYASPKVQKEWPCYLYDKNCIAMRDAFSFTGNREALTILSKMTDWAMNNLPKRSDEWYTLPENLLNCYALTGETRYLQLAERYNYSEGFYNVFAAGKNGFAANLHAYSHINTLCSCARLYQQTRDPKYLTALKNAFTFLETTQAYASGGWGPDEHFVRPGKGELVDFIHKTGQGFETPCGTYANVNVDRYLMRFTGQAQYGDNMERVLYNGQLAALPPLQDGHGFYYSDYRPGTHKIRRDDPWTCCLGTYAEITSDYPTDIYFHDKSTLFANLFVPSVVHWTAQDSPVAITQTSEYPSQLATNFAVTSTRPSRFELAVRIPSWMAGVPEVLVNGKRAQSVTKSNGWCKVERLWNSGDRLSIHFSAKPKFEPIDAEHPNLGAITVGPDMLVAIANGEVTIKGDRSSLDRWFYRDGDDWVSRDGKTRLRPFRLIGNEHYTTYLTLQSE